MFTSSLPTNCLIEDNQGDTAFAWALFAFSEITLEGFN
jgi:hypothetical protein